MPYNTHCLLRFGSVIFMERYILYNREYRLAICVACATGLPSGYVLKHMKEEHSDTWKTHRKELQALVGSLSLCTVGELDNPTP